MLLGHFIFGWRVFGEETEEILESVILPVEPCYLTQYHHLWNTSALVIVIPPPTPPSTCLQLEAITDIFVSVAHCQHTDWSKFFTVAGA